MEVPSDALFQQDPEGTSLAQDLNSRLPPEVMPPCQTLNPKPQTLESKT